MKTGYPSKMAVAPADLQAKILRSRNSFIEEKKKKLEQAANKKAPGGKLDKQPQAANLGKYKYPFENLVFEGGGSKGVAYCGAIEALEEYGIMGDIKRLAGSSAGGMTAALLAIGCSSGDIRGYLSQNLKKIILDHSWGIFSFLPNLLCNYGWNPGNKIYNWFGETFHEKTRNADITFSEVHKKFGKELCIVVTNVNTMEVEYFCPRTTPDVAVRLAVRMTMAIPLLFQPVPLKRLGENNLYVDGGVLCNYPIHCFDGHWVLNTTGSISSRVNDGNDLQTLLVGNARFATYNEATLGFVVYADNERDILQDKLKKRANKFQNLPPTKLAGEKIRKKKILDQVEHEDEQTRSALKNFIKQLPKPDGKGELPKADVVKTFGKLKQVEFEYLFGKNVKHLEAADALDINGNGKISYDELLHFSESMGLSFQECFLSYQRQEVNRLSSFMGAVVNAVSTNLKRLFVNDSDIERTVGINTGHIGTADFDLEPGDIKYAVIQGKLSTEAFLEHYVNKHNPPLKPGHGLAVKGPAVQGLAAHG